MKFKSLFLAALSASMLLTGCGGNNVDQSSVVDSGSSSSEQSGQASVAERKAALASFIKKVAPNNVTMEISVSGGTGSSNYTSYYLGADAFMVSQGDSSQGILVNNDQGFFLFTVEEGNLSFHGCQGLGNDITTYFTTPSGVLADTKLYQYVDFEGEGYSFDFNTKQMIKDLTSYVSKGTGSTCLYFLLNLVGSTGSYYKYVSSLNLTIASDLSYADLTVKLAAGKTIQTYACHLSDFGATEVAAVSTYLAEAKDFAAPSAWDEDCTKAISSVFAGKESDVIFPIGLVSASFDQQALVYSSEESESEENEGEEGAGEKTPAYNYAGIQWTHYGDDLTKGYGKALVSAGYEYAGSQESSDDGYTHYYYQKEFSAQTEEEGATYIQCDWYYVSSIEEFTCQIYLATDALRYECGTVAEANAKIAEINETATYDIPLLSESEAIKGTISVADYSSLYQESIGCTYYYIFDLTFASETEATSYAKSYIASISGSYQDTGSFDFDEDGAVAYVVPYGQSYAAALQILKGQMDSGDYVIEIRAFGI